MNTKQRWILQEDIDGCHIYPGSNPEDLVWGRVKPVAKIEDSDEALELVRYLQKLPAFRGRARRKRMSRAARLQREHEHQSNRDAVASGSYIQGY